MQKHLRAVADAFQRAAVSAKGQSTLQAERRKTGQTPLSAERIRRVSGALYECLTGDMDCSHRFSFGYGYFCSWLLNDRSGGFDSKPPCFRRKDDENDQRK